MSYPSIEQVANISLGHLGNWTTDDVYKDSNVERLIRLHFPQVRRTLLRQHPWNFAIQRVRLELSELSNSFGAIFRYALPSDYLQTITLWQDEESLYRLDKFKIEGQAVVTDAEEAWLEYVADISCTESWSPDFIEAFTLKLASKLAIPLGGSEGKAASLMQELEQVVMPRVELNNAWEDLSGENNPIEEIMRTSEILQRHNTEF